MVSVYLTKFPMDRIWLTLISNSFRYSAWIWRSGESNGGWSSW